MTALKSQPVSPPDPPRDIPPLQNGDRLTRIEFERRYAAMPESVRAELIEGIVYIPSPVRHRKHSKPHATLIGWLSRYVSRTPGLSEFGGDGTVRLDADNEPQPDVYLLLPAVAGGRALVDADDYITGPPDLACEIAASTVSIDLNAKFNVYRRNQVNEYLVWRTEDSAIDWFVLREGSYHRLAVPADNILRSEVFPGLWLDIAALLAADLPKLFYVLDLGTSTPDHAAFVQRLKPASL